MPLDTPGAILRLEVRPARGARPAQSDEIGSRFAVAKRLLETTELDISEVSARTGFQTVQHFSRVFSRRSGISPKNYRLQVRAQN